MGADVALLTHINEDTSIADSLFFNINNKETQESSFKRYEHFEF